MTDQSCKVRSFEEIHRVTMNSFETNQGKVLNVVLSHQLYTAQYSEILNKSYYSKQKWRNKDGFRDTTVICFGMHSKSAFYSRLLDTTTQIKFNLSGGVKIIFFKTSLVQSWHYFSPLAFYGSLKRSSKKAAYVFPTASDFFQCTKTVNISNILYKKKHNIHVVIH